MNERGFTRADFLKGFFAATATGGLVTTMTGCKSLPTVEAMYTASLSIGYAAGMVANMCKIKDEDRIIVIDIVNIVSQTVPQPGQSFKEAWTPIANAHVQKLIDEGKIDQKAGDLILVAFYLVVKGIDYIFDVRFTKAKEYVDLVIAAIDGFTTGFLDVFKPVNPNMAKFYRVGIPRRQSKGERYFDRAAYEYLSKQL